MDTKSHARILHSFLTRIDGSDLAEIEKLIADQKEASKDYTSGYIPAYNAARKAVENAIERLPCYELDLIAGRIEQEVNTPEEGQSHGHATN